MTRDTWLATLSHLPQSETLTESPIELALYRTLRKYLAINDTFVPDGSRASGQLYPQVNLPTRAGVFRADFLLVAGEQITLIECDGASFHADPFDDHLRSAFILDAGLVDQIIRFNGTMLHHAPLDAALWTAAVAPAAFWAGALNSIRRAATPEGVAALDSHARELTAGYSDFSYVAHIEDTSRYPDEEEPAPTRRAGFAGLYHATAPARTRLGEVIDTLARNPVTSTEALERTYWAETKARGEERTAAFWESAQRQQDAESGPFTRELFDDRWAILLDRFAPRRPRADVEVYYAALAPLKYAGQFERAFTHIFNTAQHFPTPEELLAAAAHRRDDSGLW